MYLGSLRGVQRVGGSAIFRRKGRECYPFIQTGRKKMLTFCVILCTLGLIKHRNAQKSLETTKLG
jgi:hypothetical protein